MKQKWINFIVRQYRKYYKDPIDDIANKLKEKNFKSKAELFNFICKNSIGGLKSVLNRSLFSVKKGDDKNERSKRS